MTSTILCAVLAAACVLYAAWPGTAERYAASCEPRPQPEPEPVQPPKNPRAPWACREWQRADDDWLRFQLFGPCVDPPRADGRPSEVA